MDIIKTLKVGAAVIAGLGIVLLILTVIAMRADNKVLTNANQTLTTSNEQKDKQLAVRDSVIDAQQNTINAMGVLKDQMEELQGVASSLRNSIDEEKKQNAERERRMQAKLDLIIANDPKAKEWLDKPIPDSLIDSFNSNDGGVSNGTGSQAK